MKRQTELTTGNVWKQLILFCIPIFIGQLFQQLYNTVDSIVVGRYVSSDALAAVTASGTVTHFIVNFFLGMTTGASVLFSMYYAAGDKDKLDVSVHTTLLFSGILGILLTAVTIVLSPQLLEILHCPESVLSEALVYLRIYLVGMLFTATYNTAAAVMRSTGDSQSPFYYLVIASIMNIVLDLFFVRALQMGVAGVGIATVISQFSSVALSVHRLRKPDSVCRISVSKLRIDRQILKRIIVLGIPAGIQTSIQSIANMVTQTYINGFGAYAMAGIGSAMKIDQFAGMSAQSLGLGVTTYISQNIGAKKYARVRSGIRVSTILCIGIIGVTSVPIYIFAPQLMRIFTTDEKVITAGVGMLKTIMPFYEIMGLNQLYSGIIRGFGRTSDVMYSSLFGMVLCRQVWLAYGMSAIGTIQVIYRGYPLGWIMMGAALTFCYYRNVRPVLKQETQLEAGN